MTKEKVLTKRQLQAIHKKSEIYEKAIELLKEKDFQNITIEETCGNAGVSVGTFYHYFSTTGVCMMAAAIFGTNAAMPETVGLYI
ncbi:TetR/AcrR family transcriptional regulator [Bacillus sp. EB600]|uniref:TetR/AcrR family transcriptional regulator n=1 Tax=Bacillus sp. EB600 TaxID=2806345 RepID=UPI00210BB6D1|nr:TetR/AcrR family transcriptional regulator [Bacillus sp. EB600]MCQ6280260.1 TetR/AcrR family transcriptional regulator [Bacillus sp. EB600]